MKAMPVLRATPLLILLSACCLPCEARTKANCLLRSARKAGQIDHIEVLLEVGGDVSDKADGKVNQEKMSVVCNLTYAERTLRPTADADHPAESVRYYEKAVAVVKVGKDGFKPTLRDARQLIATQYDGRKVTLFSPQGPLTREELEVIDILGNSLLLDDFLPGREVSAGDTWEHSPELLGALLGLEEVGQSKVESRLAELNERSALIHLKGNLAGAVNGVTTEVQLKAKYRFNRKTRRIDWFGLLVRERRKSSPVADGFDAVARVQLKITPKAEYAALSNDVVTSLKLDPAVASKLQHESSQGDWSVAHDRRWIITADRHDLTVLRMIDRGEYLAQCKVSPLPKTAAEQQITLEKFQEDVRRALGDSFGEFIEAGQGVNDANYRVYRIVARGKVADLPIQWSYYMLSDEHGHQVVLAFSVEGKLVEQFGQIDRELVADVRFLEPKLASNGESKQ